MTPESPLSRFFGAAAAYLSIDGLALCCFNRRSRPAQWELAFLRDEHHALEMRVRQQDQSGKIVRDEAHLISPTATIIELQVQNGSESHYQDYPEGYLTSRLAFSRGGLPNEDFRWVINFIGGEVPHGEFVKLKTKREFPERVNVTLMRIPFALFYTRRVTDDPVVLAPQAADNPNDGFVLGKSDDTLGAFIFSEGSGDMTLVTNDGAMNEIRLPSVEGHVYQVSITNLDRPKRIAPMEREMKSNYVKGDFHYYYNVVQVDGEPYDLWAPARFGPRGRDGDCHVVGVSLDTLEMLLE